MNATRRRFGFCLAAAACSSPSSSVGVNDLPDALAGAECALAVRCGTMPDMQTCLAAAFPGRAVGLHRLQADVAAHRVRYDSGAAGECVDTIAGLSCDVSLHGSPLEDACRPTFTGSIVPGQPCGVDDECASHECDTGDCAQSRACCSGTCQAVPAPIAPGGDCGAPHAKCAGDAYCRRNDAGDTCAPRVPIGHACDDLDACSGSAICDLSPDGGAGACAALPDEGQACRADAFLACARSDDYCDSDSRRCTRRKGDDAPCRDHGECLGWLHCYGGHCGALPHAGERCDPDERPCLGDLRCTDGTCAEPSAPAECSAP